MRTLSLLRVAAAAAGVAGSITVAAAASASSGTISINPGNVPATAASYEQECSDGLGGGPYAGKDVWVFNLPGNADRSGSFTSISAAFDTNGDGTSDTTVLIDSGAADGDDIVTIGHSKAYAITDAGWTLTGATATITGDADKFVLTHTCAAQGGGTTPPSTPSTTPTTAPTTPTTTAATPTTPATPTSPASSATTAPTAGTPTTSPTSPTTAPATSPAGETPTPTPSGSVTAAGGAGAGGASTGGGLALTGANAGGAAAVALALIGGGAVLALRRRRRFVA
ncbi:hypothetical protein ACQP2F_02650 [Actinoplanes sp. CA-030573]|uniref:hypothetical protein n=1 Tax=Actinoplanes sp. CA-030573 TaxID=3239898 RepID=UPI003D8D2791